MYIFNFIKNEISKSLFYKIIFILFIISFIIMNLYVIFISFLPQLFYYYTILFFGFLIIKYQNNIIIFIKNIKIKNSYLKPILVGYFMVLFEEFFAALFSHLTEDFSFSIFLLRIFQFQFFNVFAFTSIIIALTYILKKYKFSKKEFFTYIGIFSIFSEGIYTNIFLILGLGIPNAVIYSIIFYPIYLSIDEYGKKEINIYLKFILFILIIILITFITSPIVDLLRFNYPFLFPPTKFIP